MPDYPAGPYSDSIFSLPVISPTIHLHIHGQLYVVENQTNSVSMINPRSRLAQKRISVGITPRRLLSAPQKIYCTNFRGKSISDLRQNNLGAIQTIILNDTPLEMVFHNRHNKLFVNEKNTAGIGIIDTNINQVI